MGFLDSELLFAIVRVQFRMPRGGNTKTPIVVSIAATGVRVQEVGPPTTILSAALSGLPRPRGFDRSDSFPH
jgi:hypothetical protein